MDAYFGLLELLLASEGELKRNRDSLFSIPYPDIDLKKKSFTPLTEECKSCLNLKMLTFGISAL